MQTVFIVDRGIDGILSALFYSFTEKEIPVNVYTMGSFVIGNEKTNVVKVGASESEKERVKRALIRYGGGVIISHINKCLTSSNKYAYLIAFNFCYETLYRRANMYSCLSEQLVIDFIFCVSEVLQTENNRKNIS